MLEHSSARGSAPSATQEPDAVEPLALEGLTAALDRAVDNLRRRQEDDGHWAGDYGGPMFLLPGLVITFHLSGTRVAESRRESMIRYLRHTQNADGGYGLHVEGESTVLGTALNYVALRLLGVSADDGAAASARARLHELGGAEGIPTWGKFWLAVLGVYHWDGVPPLLPELYLLPRSLPVHPSNLWCHTRQVFLPMSYVYARRHSGPPDATCLSLREEMLTEPFDDIDWIALRDHVARGDLHRPRTPLLNAMNRLLALYERRPVAALRERASRLALEHIRHEDQTTSFLTIGPVSKAMHTLIAWFEGPTSPEFERHIERCEDYLYEAEEGTKMQGYNGSQLWDAAFAMLAMLESGRAVEGAHRDVLERAHGFLDAQQVKANVPDGARYYRDPIIGSWPFSTAEQTWTVSDCTAEGLKAALKMQTLAERPLPLARLRPAVDFLLAGQNADGGWSEYERSRAPAWIEALNAAEVFGPIMRAYSYVECTSACLQALDEYVRADPGYRAPDVAAATELGLRFVRETQRADGLWIGGWGLCFTYGTWFGVDALAAVGQPEDRVRIQRACRSLIAHQRPDGAFGESYRASVYERWIGHEDPQPVQTAWALLALLSGEPSSGGDPAHRVAIERAARFLLEAQEASGAWPEGAITGVFNRTCMIHYDNYRHVMPLWALARYHRSRHG